MTTKTIEEIRVAMCDAAWASPAKDSDYLTISDAIDELADLRTQVQALTAERDAAVTEAARLRKLFDDAGQGEHDALALIEYYQELEGKACHERDIWKRRAHERVAEEREACAKACEANANRFSEAGEDSDLYNAHMADARDIRARGKL